MSFLSELKKQKAKLKETETVVTSVNGTRFMECSVNQKQTLMPSTLGFVVDTKPDKVPVLITDYLYIGSQDCTASEVIKQYYISNIVSLGIKVEFDNVKYKFIECLDLPETDILPVLAEALPFIHHSINNSEPVLVHCNAGVSRTSMVAIGYLMQYELMEFEDAYKLVKEKRPAIQPNTGFKKQLQAMRPGCILK